MQSQPIAIDSIVQVLETCGVAGHIGLLGYVKEITGPFAYVDVYTVPSRLSQNAERMTIGVRIDDLFGYGPAELLPND